MEDNFYAYMFGANKKQEQTAEDSKPEAATLEALKVAGYRWHKVKKLWYAKNTPDRLQLAKAITGGEPITAPAADPVNKSVYLLTGEAKEKFIARYSEVKNARDDGTAHQFTLAITNLQSITELH